MKQSAENERRQRCRNAARLAAVLGLAVVLAGLAGCTKLKARDQLNKGVLV